MKSASELAEALDTPPLHVRDIFSKTLNQQGWAVYPNLLNDELLLQLTAETDRILAATRSGVTATSAASGDGVLVVNSLDAKSEILFDFARTTYMMGLAETFLGKAAQPIHIEFFGKPSPGSPPTPPHQDQVFYNDHFNDEPAVTFWCPLKDVSPDDGCLEYGSPYPAGRLLPHERSQAVDFGAQLFDDSEFSYTAAPVRAGDCLVHTAWVVHRSGPMRSAEPRRVLAFNYRGSSFKEKLRIDGIRS